jgi:YggT family protein
MQIIGELLLFILNIFTFVIIAQVVISWLVVFGVVNLANPQATNLINLLGRITDPVMQPIRRFVPALGGIDITPIIVIFGIMLLQRLVGIIFFF